MPCATIRDGVSLFYEDLGDGTPVVLVHGGFMSHRVWETQVPALLDEGYRVITPDLRGHGRSAKPVSTYTAEMHTSDLEALRATLGVDTLALVGWSLGAMIATAYAAAHPGRLTRFCLISTGIFEGLSPTLDRAGGDRGDQERCNQREEKGLDITALLRQQQTDRPAGVAAYVDRMFSVNRDVWTKQWLWSLGMQTPQRVALKTLDIYQDLNYDAMTQALSAVNVPGATFHGARDGAARLEAAEYVAEEIFERGTFIPFYESGHLPFLTETERFNNNLLTFLRD